MGTPEPELHVCVWWLDSHYANSRIMDQGASKGEKGSEGGKMGGGGLGMLRGNRVPGGGEGAHGLGLCRIGVKSQKEI
jgi:hypothetical protein